MNERINAPTHQRTNKSVCMHAIDGDPYRAGVVDNRMAGNMYPSFTPSPDGVST